MNGRIHFGVLLCVMLLGTASNATIIHIYFKRNTHDKVYFLVMLLATLDLFACFTPIVFDGLLKSHEKDNNSMIPFVHYRIVRFIILSNLSILGTMATDRVLAVFRPYIYKTFKAKIRYSALVLILFCAVETLMSSLFYTKYGYARIVFVGTALCCGLIIICIYLVIVCKLYRERRRVDSASIQNEAATPRAIRGAWTTANRSEVYHGNGYVKFVCKYKRDFIF